MAGLAYYIDRGPCYGKPYQGSEQHPSPHPPQSALRKARAASKTWSTEIESMHSHAPVFESRHFVQSAGMPTGEKIFFFCVYGPQRVALNGAI